MDMDEDESPHTSDAREAWKDLEEGWREEDQWAQQASRPKFYRTVQGGQVPDQFRHPMGAKE